MLDDFLWAMPFWKIAKGVATHQKVKVIAGKLAVENTNHVERVMWTGTIYIDARQTKTQVWSNRRFDHRDTMFDRGASLATLVRRVCRRNKKNLRQSECSCCVFRQHHMSDVWW